MVVLVAVLLMGLTVPVEEADIELGRYCFQAKDTNSIYCKGNPSILDMQVTQHGPYYIFTR